MAESRKSTGARTDANLKKQLKAAKGTDAPVEAVLSLRPPSKASKAASTGGARQRADSAIKRVQDEVGSEPSAVNVLDLLDMVVIEADESFLSKLLEQPEFESAVANAYGDDAEEPTPPAKAAPAKSRSKASTRKAPARKSTSKRSSKS